MDTQQLYDYRIKEQAENERNKELAAMGLELAEAAEAVQVFLERSKAVKHCNESWEVYWPLCEALRNLKGANR